MEAIPYKFDPPFRAAARKKQSDFRKEVLKVAFDPKDRLAKYGNLLRAEDAKRGLNFYEGYRESILKEIGPYKKPLFANLLRSEHIPWNVFFPMGMTKEHLEASVGLFNEILGFESIKSIEKIIIERTSDALNDHTAFDAYIEYKHIDGSIGGIGIEVKYTEEAYPLKKGSREEEKAVLNPAPLYVNTTRNCGYYRQPEEDYCLLVSDEFRQIWRNHILGAAMKLNGEIAHFHSVHLYPSFNTHFNEVLPKYQALLTKKGYESFRPVTFEQLFKVMSKHFNKTKDTPWIQYLWDRYII